MSNNGFGKDSGDRGASDMVHRDNNVSQHMGDLVGLRFILTVPSGVVSNDFVSHRYQALAIVRPVLVA